MVALVRGRKELRRLARGHQVLQQPLTGSGSTRGRADIEQTGKTVLKEGVLQDRDPNHVSFLLENVTAASPDLALKEFLSPTETELAIAIRKSANILKNSFADRTHRRFEYPCRYYENHLIWDSVRY